MSDAALVGVLEARIAALTALVKIRFVGAMPFEFEEAEEAVHRPPQTGMIAPVI